MSLPLLLVAGLFGASDASAAVNLIAGDDRLFKRFIEDGAIVRKGWIELGFGYADHPDSGRDIVARSAIAFRFGRDVEAGLIGGVIDRHREAGSTLFGATLIEPIDGAGLSDFVLYGKYRIVRSPIELSVGGMATVPLADEDAGRGPGVLQYEGFAGLRKNLRRVSVVFSAGVAGRGDSEAPGMAESRTSLKLGAGMLVPVGQGWLIVAEVTYESARFEGEAQASVVLGGVEWRPTPFMGLRGEVEAGLNDAAADLAGLLSFVFHF